MEKSINNYFDRLKSAIDKLDRRELSTFINTLLTARDNDKHIYIMGNGGSASTASHFVCDFNKGMSYKQDKKFKMICLNDNVATMLAYSNDVGYDDVFVEQLKNFLQKGDVVIGISGSGNSKNILKAIEYANSHGAITVGLTGYDGGEETDLLAILPGECTADLEEVKAEMDGIIGLDEVKDYVLRLEDAIAVQRRRAAAGMKTAGVSMHMIFTGNPGTGKTTIARLVARYLKAIGALRGGQLVEVSRGDLVGRYTGHTAPLTNSVIESALGGVLFIDEAYSLYRGEQDSFGLEAIDTLVKGMEDHRDDLVVILAGYTREMQQFLTANSGLASRFPNQIEFPDYTADQLLDITVSLAAARGYRLDDSCTFPLLGYYQRRQAADSRTAGNGRLARNTLEKAIYNQSRRLVAEPDAPLDLILAGDLEWEE